MEGLSRVSLRRKYWKTCSDRDGAYCSTLPISAVTSANHFWVGSGLLESRNGRALTRIVAPEVLEDMQRQGRCVLFDSSDIGGNLRQPLLGWLRPFRVAEWKGSHAYRCAGSTGRHAATGTVRIVRLFRYRR